MRLLRTISQEAQRTICSKRFVFAMLIMTAGLVAGCLGGLIATFKELGGSAGKLRWGTAFGFFGSGIESDAAHFVLPICAALPGSCLFIEDMTSGFVKGYLPRTGRAVYISVRCLTNTLCSALAAVCGMLLFRLLLGALLAPFSSPPEEGYSFWQSIRAMLPALALYGSAAAFWSAAGLLLSSLTMNRFSAMASPFILFYLMEIIVSQYLTKAFKLMPSLYLMEYGAYEKALMPAAVSCAAAIVLLAVFALTASVRIRRQV